MKMKEKFLPTISVLMPTLNASSVIESCLKSIIGQDYPKNKIEIVVGDGGSSDNTIEIAKKYGAKIYHNPLKTAESGKATAFHHAKNDLVVLIDSDNILPQNDWFKKMVEPFIEDEELVGSEPWEYTYRKTDGFVDRYCALMGMNDPICYFLGNYDRKNTLTGKWTSLGVAIKDKGKWIKSKFIAPDIPTVGANGTFFKRDFLEKSKLVRDYLFDVDILVTMAVEKPVFFAKVKIGIIHLYCGSSVQKFIRKQKRRVKDFLYHKKVGDRKYPWQSRNKLGLFKFAFSCITIFPLLYHVGKGYLRKRDLAWFFHPFACWLTFFIYCFSYLQSFWKTEEISRKGWKQ